MKKHSKTILIATGIIIVILISAFTLFISTNENIEYTTGKDVYHVFGNGRFQIGLYGNRFALDDKEKSLNQESFNDTLILKVEKYIDTPPYAYVEGYYYSASGIHKDGYPIYTVTDISSGEDSYKYSLNEIPKYMVLDYEEAIAEFYFSLNEMDSETQRTFKQETNWWCRFIHTCYESDD